MNFDFFGKFHDVTPKTPIYIYTLPILCIWLFWKSLTWLVYQILDDFGRKHIFIKILCIWLFWKSLTWLVYQKGLTFFKSPRNVSLIRASLLFGPDRLDQGARRFGDFEYIDICTRVEKYKLTLIFHLMLDKSMQTAS